MRTGSFRIISQGDKHAASRPTNAQNKPPRAVFNFDGRRRSIGNSDYADSMIRRQESCGPRRDQARGDRPVVP